MADQPTAEQLKMARDLAINKLRTANKKLTDSIAADRARNAERYHTEIQATFEKFEACHIDYGVTARLNIEDQAMADTFFQASELLDVAENTYSVYKEQIQKREETNRLEKESAARKRKAAEGLDKLKLELLTEMTQIIAVAQEYATEVEQETVDNKTVLAKEMEHLEGRMKLVKASCARFIENADAAAAETMLEKRVNTERELRRHLFKVRSFTDEDVGGLSRPSSASSSRPSSPSSQQSSTSSFRHKKIEFPKFSGVIRNYQTFKRDFKDIVEDTGAYDDKYKSQILRYECLSGEAKLLVHNIHAYEDLWKKLDDKYDDPGEVVEQISKQITELRKVEEEDYTAFIKLVDVVERAHLDLSAMGHTAILNNPMTVRLILTKCPRMVKENLAKELSTKKQEEEFDVMLQFLIQRRREATRLARLQDDTKASKPQGQGRQKGSVHATDYKKDDKKSGSKAKDNTKKAGNWDCPVANCTYKQKHFLSECRAFKKLAVNDKGKFVLEKKLCVLCFSPGHDVGTCPKKTAGWRVCDEGGCGKWHSRWLHGAVVPGLALTTRAGAVGAGSRTLLLAQSIPTLEGKQVNTLWDSGSTISLVSNSFAGDVGLEGVDCGLELTGVGEKTQMYSTKMYIVNLLDKQGEISQIQCFGIDKITQDLLPADVTTAAEVFDKDVELLDRPAGPVHLLIGMNHADILPVKTDVKKRLALYSSPFGSGYVVGGILEAEEDCAEILHIFAHQVSHVGGRVVQPVDFLSAEAFGVDIPRRCRFCRGCKECGFRAKALTWTEQKELMEIEKGLTLDTVNKKWTASYPFNTDPSVMHNNYSQACACLHSLERRLKKNNQVQQFDEQFQDAVNRGVFKELSREEADSYDGPVNYVTLTEAFKEGDQVTTPLRLCMNSSMKFRGISLNEILMKGPSSLNNIFSVLVNFRAYPVAFVKDISKFYQSVGACTRDQHLRRVIWRGADENVPPKIYSTQTVNFGDKPAGCIALTSLRQTADLYQHIDVEAAEKLKKCNYVDDVATGAEDKARALKVSLNMDKIVEMGGFKFKSTIMSGDAGEPRKILGTGWDTLGDTLFIEVKVNTSSKRKGIRTQPDIEFANVQDEFPEIITKRIIWRVVLGQFDLLGLASVFFIRLKLLMRDLSGVEGQKIGWDTPLANDLRNRFVDLLTMMEGVQKLRFPRCIKPPGVKPQKKPDLLVFGDGSKQAFCALAYLRWELETGGFKCFLVAGKTRVAPIKKISVPRLELLGSLACVRLAASIQDSLSIQIGQRFFFTDSSAVFGMIRGDCGSFQEFVGTRTGEIKSKSDPDKEWFWVPTAENLADLGTRNDVTPEMMGPESAYLNGQAWMQQEFVTWPVNQQPGGSIPDEEKVPAARVHVTAQAEPFINYGKYDSFSKIIRIVAILFRAKDKLLVETGHKLNKSENKKRISKIKILQKSEYLEIAENFVLFQAQKSLQSDFKSGKLSPLSPKLLSVEIKEQEVQIISTAGRLGNALSVGYDRESLPILDYKASVSKSIITDAHRSDHCGVDRTLQKSRHIAWIIKGRRLAKIVVRNCYECRIRNKKLESQVMAPIKGSRIPPTPVFYSTAIDLFGPLEIRDTVKRRTTKKVWGVIFVCTSTSAIHLEVTEDYSCDSFLLCLRRFANLRGIPARVQSDPGTQLMAAASELGKWDFSKIREWPEGYSTEWVKTPTDSQHFNGAAEAMIKVTKKQLSANLKERTFTKGEMDTLLSNITHLVNSRPLMKKAGECPLSGGPITPLHLIGGRATIDLPRVNMDSEPRLTKRLKFIEQTTHEFWSKWFTQVFHSLVPSYKWRTESRNVKQGDVVLLKESNQLKGEYRLAKVSKAEPGEDGKVRRITLQYKNLKSTGCDSKKAMSDLKNTTFSETERCVQNVVVIVPADWKTEEIDAAVSLGIKYN